MSREEKRALEGVRHPASFLTCLGAHPLEERECRFRLWSPLRKRVSVISVSPESRTIPMKVNGDGYWEALAEGVPPDLCYFYELDEEMRRPDPASHFQPEGVHGPSQAVKHNAFPWEDKSWKGILLREMIIYELHVGTFTREGTFDAIIPRLDDLAATGINAVELMPVAQFAGERNWGYDGAYPFAVQSSYGGPDGLKRLVNACHRKGQAVILDVVYNHLGPEGNYLADFAPYFTDRYRTPWGKALNFDGAFSDHVRRYFIENALYWLSTFHLDGLRLDAVHGIFDMSARPFLQELAESVATFSRERGRQFYLMAESDCNDPRHVRSRESGGFGIDAQWCDDFHHSLHTLLTGEQAGYYRDFGKLQHLEKALREGFVYSWDYSPFRKRRHGSSSREIPPSRFVVFSQNHDQVGNRMLGERLSRLCSFEDLKLAAGALFLSPYIPMLFMGEEYGEEAPFLYFVSHSDPALIEAVRKGRREEFQSFEWQGSPPDPQDLSTFLQSRLQWEKRDEGKHRVLLDLHRELIRLRKKIPALSIPDRSNLQVSCSEEEKLLFLARQRGGSHLFSVMNFSHGNHAFSHHLPGGEWKKILDSSDLKWLGPGPLSPEKIPFREECLIRGRSFVLYHRQKGEIPG